MRGVDNMPKGTSRRHPDRWTVPLCHKHHLGSKDSAHMHGNDEVWLASKGIDGRALAAALWKRTGDYEAMLRITERART